MASAFHHFVTKVVFACGPKTFLISTLSASNALSSQVACEEGEVRNLDRVATIPTATTAPAMVINGQTLACSVRLCHRVDCTYGQ